MMAEATKREDIGHIVSAAVDQAMINELGHVSDDEIRDPKIHARRCGPRFALLAAMCLENGDQSRNNATKLERTERRLLLAVLASTFVLGGMMLGKEKGAEAVMKIAGWLFL